jgi:large subunit ribosomal protein L4
MATSSSTPTTVAVDLPAEIFDVQTNVPLIHQVVVAQLAAARQGTHATKSRGMVRGGGRKPYRQKGTGRARQGSTRAPQFAGGGVVHGPHPRDYAQRTPKKMKAAALRGALSDRARHGRIHVVSAIALGDSPSAKAAAALLDGLTDRPNLLVVLDRSDIVSMKSVRNLANVHVLAVDQLNTYDVLCADDVVFTEAALEAFIAGPTTVVAVEDLPVVTHAPAEQPAKADSPPAAVDAETVTAAEPAVGAVAELPAGAVAATADGAAPEGYTVKGNADSSLYHAPGGRWYDSTVAEFWFADEAAAEAAGLKKAGSRAKKTDDDPAKDK